MSTTPPAPAAPPDTPFSLAHFQRTLIYDRAAPPAALLADLQELAKFDVTMEGEEARWKGRTGWTVAALVLCLIGTIASFAMAIVSLGAVLAIGLPCLLIGAIFCGARWHHFSKYNLDNRRVILPSRVLSFLALDAHKEHPLSLRIDFRPYRDAAFLKQQHSQGMFSSQRAYQYVVPWLEMSGQLLDGQRFALELTTVAKRKEKSKRKYTKVREVFRERLRLALRVKRAKYEELPQLDARLRAAGVPFPLRASGFRVVEDTVELQAVSDGHFRSFGRGQTPVTTMPTDGICTADHALQAFLTTYAGLALCRKK